MEYFKYMVDMLRERGADHVRVFGGGGGTITPDEISELHTYGVERVYHPNDGMKLGLVEMIEDLVDRTNSHRKNSALPAQIKDEFSTGQMLSAIENGIISRKELEAFRDQWQEQGSDTPVIGLTGTGGRASPRSPMKSLIAFYWPTRTSASRFWPWIPPDARVAVLCWGTESV